MLGLLRAGFDIGITPDGPRGPRYRVQSGVISLARLSGRPVYPVTFAADRFHSFNSWDRFQVPRLFARGVFIWGEPMRVRRGEDLEEKRMELEARLADITTLADNWFSGESRVTERPTSTVEQ